MNRKIILASASPRRREILKNMGLDFEIIPSEYEETFDSLDFTYEKIEELAYNKAKFVLNKINIQDSVIVSADTVVVLDNKILGKPLSKQQAKEMLLNLSGKKHSVVTSICVIDSKTLNKRITSVTSYVEFEKLSETLIIDYIENYNPLDKAGSYGIQELPAEFIREVSGSFENIIGLCSIALKNILNELV